MSRNTDAPRSLQQRTDEANAWGADAYVAIHCNAHTNPAASGFEVWHTVFTSQSRGDELARSIVQWLDRLTPLLNRGAKSRRNESGRDDYHVIRETCMPAVIVECGFITNPQDAAYLASSSGQAAIAEAIARGTVEWAGVAWVPGEVVYYRLKTGTFSNAASLAAGIQRVQDLFGWQTYEWAEGPYTNGGIWSPRYRIFTGTFEGRAAAEQAASKLRQATGWVVDGVQA